MGGYKELLKDRTMPLNYRTLNALEFKEITEVQNTHLKMFRNANS